LQIKKKPAINLWILHKLNSSPSPRRIKIALITSHPYRQGVDDFKHFVAHLK